jgi:hypothetical protein
MGMQKIQPQLLSRTREIAQHAGTRRPSLSRRDQNPQTQNPNPQLKRRRSIRNRRLLLKSSDQLPSGAYLSQHHSMGPHQGGE